VPDEILKASFRVWWPELEEALKEAKERLGK
jgi:hypothetical protein